MASETITFHLCRVESSTVDNVGVMKDLVKAILFTVNYIDRFINLIHPGEREIVPQHATTVPIFDDILGIG